MSQPPPFPLDLAIAGAGVAGLTLALALKAELGPTLRVAAFDPALGQTPRDDGRATMIAADGRRLLERVGAWPEGAAPVADLRITDSRLDDVIRPTFLELGGSAGSDEPFAHMTFDAELRALLRARCEQAGVTLEARAITAHAAAGGLVTLGFDRAEAAAARLLVAADGAGSGVRARERIKVYAYNYDQIALVATLAHEVPHAGVAVQHFLPGGPFAMLPLAGNRSSLVWSERSVTAEAMIAADDAAFLAEVERRAGPDYGAIRLDGPRGAFALRFLLARSFVGRRVALVGDAGHVVHPLAGQGLNAGLRDVMALTRIVAEAARAGEDFGADVVLQRYETARRFDVAALGAATDGLYRLFGTGFSRGVRDVGMGLVDRTPALKRKIEEMAGGGSIAGRLPRDEPAAHLFPSIEKTAP